jgi:hypothetical protein
MKILLFFKKNLGSFAIGVMVLVLAGWQKSGLQGFEKSEKKVSVKESRILTLAKLSKTMRDGTGIEFYVDKREEARQVFVSKGAYDVFQLMDLLAFSTRLVIRKIDDVYFLTREVTPFSKHVTLWPEELTGRLERAVAKIEQNTDLKGEGIPFSVEGFRKKKVFAFKELSNEQKEFVCRAHFFIPTQDVGPPGLKGLRISDGDLKKEIRFLENKSIRLGRSFVISLLVFGSPSGNRLTSPIYWETFQFYYDYGDRFRRAINKQ